MSVLTLNVNEVMRTLSAESSSPFVTHDKEVDIVRFAINSGFADIVLDGQVALRVMYQRPGEMEVRAQTLTYYDTDGLHNYYDWQLSQSDLAKNGSLMVALCILDISGGEVSEWHTTPCAVRVLSTIHTDDSDEGDDTITPTVKERVAVLESMIQRVASGAPIVVASASDMTDTDQIYVLSTDGNWYYHNGTAWVAGGEYGAVATDTTLTQSGVPADAKKTGDEITAIKADLGDINSAVGDFVTKNESITGVAYINPNDFDIGNITISTNGWAYSNAQTRVRTKEGTTIPLKKGDIIGLSDYANAHAYIGWRRQDGTYGAKAWLTSDYTVTEDGDYVILLSAIPEATVTSNQDLLSKLNITVVDNVKNDTIRRVEHLESLTSATRNLNTVPVGRYSSFNRQPTLAEDKYYGMSQIISCEPDTQYTATLYNVTPVVGIAVNASFYDANGTYTTRYVRSGVTSISFTTPSDCRYICIWAYNGSGIVLTDESAIQLELGNVSTQYIKPYTALDYAVRQDLDRAVTDIDASADSVTKLLFNECFDGKPFVHHIGITREQNIVVPAQSLFDIQRAKRLGFKVMELNTLATSDGAYITNHGFSGKFGGQFYSTDGTDLTNVLVSSMSLAEIKEKVRYNSIYEKYRVAPPTLEEALKECKRVGIVPLIQWKDGIKDIVDAIMGKDNYISAVYQSKRPTGFYGVVSSWLEIANPNEVVAKCNESSGAYIAALNVSSNIYSSFTEADWYNMAKTVHSAGYLIGSAYTSPLLLPVLQRAGFDMFIASYNINNIDNGNICNLYGETDFTDFTTTGTVSNNVVTLATGQEIKPMQELQTVFLGGGYLSIRFSGSIYLNMGAYLNNAYHFESDCTIPMEFTTLYENAIPTFRIVAKEDTIIYEIVFKSSVM